MRWLDLIGQVPGSRPRSTGNPPIGRVVADSRQVEPGDLFVAVRGLTTDGRRFIPQALERGAVAVVVADPPPADPPVPWATVPDSQMALGLLAAARFDHPSRKLRVIGVTGTDGKTTTVTFIEAIVRAAGFRTASISTVGAQIGSRERDTGFHVTTPDAPDVQAFLAEMVARKTACAVLEATSHGLAQQRLAGVDFDVAVVTNVAHEHLDFHGTATAYLEAKTRLFRSLADAYRKPGIPKLAVLNADDSSFARLRQEPADRHITYGLRSPAGVRADQIIMTPAGSEFVAVTPAGRWPVRLRLPGRYNVSNALAAIATGVGLNLPADAMQQGLQEVAGIVGRMERIDAGQDFIAVVDFAHTPQALTEALRAAREMATGSVIVVFGCAGLRDVQKRPLMGEIAARLADRAVITAEDPRTEDLDEIMAQIAEGLEREGTREGETFWRIGDRAEAIRFAARLAEAGDLVIVTGKGHERSMCFGTTEYPWSDQAALRQALVEPG